MRPLSFAIDGRVSWGLLDGDGIIDLGGRLELDGAATLVEALQAQDLMDIAAQAAGLPCTLSVGDAILRAPVPHGSSGRPGARGLVVGTHTASWRDGRDPLEYVAGSVEPPDAADGRPQVLLTRDEWAYSPAQLEVFRRTVADSFRRHTWAPGSWINVG